MPKIFSRDPVIFRESDDFENYIGIPEAKLNFATHSDLSVEIKDPEETSETMIGYAIDTFRMTTLTVDQKIVRKTRFETRTCHSDKYSES